MASAAGRFVFNATPAFAVMAGWVLVLIIERAEFAEFFKSMVGSRGSFLRNLRKSIKFRHIFVFQRLDGARCGHTEPDEEDLRHAGVQRHTGFPEAVQLRC